MQLLNLCAKKRKGRAKKAARKGNCNIYKIIENAKSLIESQVHRMILKNQVHRRLNQEQQDSKPQFRISEVCMFCSFK